MITLISTYYLPGTALSHSVFIITSGNYYNPDFTGVEIEAGEVKKKVSQLQSGGKSQKKIEMRYFEVNCYLATKIKYDYYV